MLDHSKVFSLHLLNHGQDFFIFFSLQVQCYFLVDVQRGVSGHQVARLEDGGIVWVVKFTTITAQNCYRPTTDPRELFSSAFAWT